MNVGWAIELLPGLRVTDEARALGTYRRTAELFHPHLEELFDFQRVAAERLAATAPNGQLLLMSPGLGKTATAIIAADCSVAPGQRVLVVCPKSLQATWDREIRRWSCMSFDQWQIASYQAVTLHPDVFRGPWEIMILDESVMIKSRASNRFAAIEKMRIGRKACVKRVWELSGSPTTRYADDLWTQLRMLAPVAFKSFWRFAERYCLTETNPWAPKGLVVTGTRRERNAVADNKDLIHVVNQEQVLDLPEYLFEAVDVTFGPRQEKAYQDMLRTFLAELDGAELSAERKMDQILRLQQISSGLGDLGSGISAKHDAIEELIAEGVYEGPHLVWTHWRKNAENLAARLAELRPTAHVYGGMKASETDALLEGYKAGKYDILVLSLGVGKFGHTFTNTKTMHYIDKSWPADDYFQSLHRVRRIGLKHRPVVVSYRAPGTVDELVERNLEGKLGTIALMTNSDLAGLLKGLGAT